MNKKLHEMALEIGGSHYPEVSKQYFESTVELFIRECEIALSPMLRDMISRGQAIESIRKHFELDK
jgi:hypothetical protein